MGDNDAARPSWHATRARSHAPIFERTPPGGGVEQKGRTLRLRQPGSRCHLIILDFWQVGVGSKPEVLSPQR
jgi:hypothetical protein